MNNLVLDIQSDALNELTSVSQLLRKAKALSVKLKVVELDAWITRELGGYAPDDDVPKYRYIIGSPKMYNPYHGWQPIHIEDDWLADLLSYQEVRQSVPQLESLAQQGGLMHMPYTNKIKMYLMERMPVPLEPTLHIPSTSAMGIVDVVRNTILEWALELESKGVLGEGMKFSNTDKEKAADATYHITNNIGSMNNSQIQQLAENSTQKLRQPLKLAELVKLVREIELRVVELDVDDSSKAQIVAEVSTVSAQASSPKPRYEAISESINSLKTILEAATGNVLAAGYLSQLNNFI